MSRPEAWVAALRERARRLYEGKETPHRSCGICLAETFGRPTPAYQSLRRGGITGEGTCGAVVAGQLVLGELLGDPDPTGAVTPALRHAMIDLRDELARRLPRPSLVCNDLVRAFGDFQSPERQAHCTDLAATVAEAVATVLVRGGHHALLERLAGDGAAGPSQP
jgi:hypothetical protein